MKDCETNHSFRFNQSLSKMNGIDFSQLQKHRLINSKANLLNTRIQKIKNKYGVHFNMSQYLQMNTSIQQNSIDNKENESININCDSNNKDKKAHHKQNQGHKKMNKSKKNDKIQELVQINKKINRLIDHLKTQEQQSEAFIPRIDLSHVRSSANQIDSIKHNSAVSSVSQYNSNLFPEKTDSVINYSSINLKQSNARPQSADRFLRQSKQKARQIGKISQRSNSMKKSEKQLRQLSVSLILQESNPIQQKRLIHMFCKQIQYDQHFINQKTKLMKCGMNSKQILEKTLRHIKLSQQQKQNILEWNIEQMDPLFTQRFRNQSQKQNKKLLALQVVESFRRSQDHWKYKIFQKFNKKSLDFSDLDSQGKGYFLKEDLTRFISLHSKNMYNNRSINLIFKRVNKKKGKIVSISDFIDSLCY